MLICTENSLVDSKQHSFESSLSLYLGRMLSVVSLTCQHCAEGLNTGRAVVGQRDYQHSISLVCPVKNILLVSSFDHLGSSAAPNLSLVCTFLSLPEILSLIQPLAPFI